MDLPATQVFDDNDLPTQRCSESSQVDESKQVATLIIDSIPHIINEGIHKIGRHPLCDIVINDPTVSKQHAEIEAGANEKSSWICDLNSSNKTKLNHVPLRANRNYELKHESVIEFGKVRAIYQVCEDIDMEKSVVPATPGLANREQVLHKVIPCTPDSSLNNSSALEEDLSSIPGTQTDELDSVFRRPSIPRLRYSLERSRKSLLHDSPLDDSGTTPSVCTVLQKSTASDQSDDVNIYDMETQESDSSYSTDDIHNMETQRISINVNDNRKTTSGLHQLEDIHTIETQDISNAICEMDTQKQENIDEKDIHDVETQKLDSICLQRQDIPTKVNSCDDTPANSTIGKRKHVTDSNNIREEVASNAEIENFHNNDDYDNDSVKLTQTPNFDEDVKLLDVSDIQGSPNLLEGYFDNICTPLNEEQSHAKESSDTSKSLEEENIFDAATQQIKNSSPHKDTNSGGPTRTLSRKGIIHIPDSESDTDDELIQIRPTRVQGEPLRSNKNGIQESDSSETDEEGQFAEYAMKHRQMTSSPLKQKENVNEENKGDPSTSLESDDIFEMPTQRIITDEDSKSEDVVLDKQIGQESLPQKIIANQNDVVDDMAPAQVISDTIDGNTSKRTSYKSNIAQEVNINKEEENVMEIDDMAPTQLITMPEDPEGKNRFESRSSVSKIKDIERPGDSTEIDMLPTQIMNVQQSTLIDESSSDSSYNDRDRSPFQHGSIENISYEMASTQPVDDDQHNAEEKTAMQNSTFTITLRNNTKRGRSRKSILDDTLEKKLNNMFEGVTRQSTRKPSLMSTQCLEDALQMSQDDRELLNIAVASGKISPIKDARVLLVKDTAQSGNSTPTLQRSTSTPHSFSTKTTSKTKSKRVSLKAKRPSIPKVPTKTMSTVRRQSRKVNLNDTIEKNLINMFDDVNEDVEEPPHISTQCLEDALQMSQAYADVNNELPSNNGASATKVTKKPMDLESDRETPLTNQFTSRKKRANLDENEMNVDSPVSDTYFAGHTTRRKRNVLRDSQDLMENTTNVDVPTGKISRRAPTNRAKRSLLMQTTLKEKSESEPSKKANESDDDFMADLPVATISGTASNPVSPSTSSTSTVDDHKTRNKGKRGSTKSKMPSTKEYLIEDSKSCHSVSSPITNLKFGKIDDSDNDHVYKKLKIIADRLLSVKPKYINMESVFCLNESNASADSDDLTMTVETHQPSNVGMERLEKIDSETCRIASRKRSLSTVGKRKENVSQKRIKFVDTKEEKAPTKLTKAKSTVGSKSETENIMKFFTSRNTRTRASTEPGAAKVSLVTANNTQITSDDFPVPRVNIKRIRLKNGETQFPSLSVAAASTQNDVKQRTELEVKTTEVKRSRRKTKVTNVALTSESGTESQEIEMIMKSASSDIGISSFDDKDTKSNVLIRNTKRNSNKRSNAKSDEESTTNNKQPFEAPTAKSKRGRPLRQKSQSNTNVLEEPPKRSTRSLRSSQASINNAEKSTSSGVEFSTDITALNSTPSRVRRSMTILSTGSPSRTKQRVLFTGITHAEYSSILNKLGGAQVEDYSKCDVLVTDKVRRTIKFLCAVGQSTPIVSLNWLTESEAAGHLLNWENFILKDPVAEAKFGFKLQKSLERAKQHKLLHGYTILLTPKVAPPSIAEFKAIILSSGGKVLVRAPAKWPANTIIVSREEDSDNARKFLSKAPGNVTAQSTEFILTGILRQELDFIKNKLL